MYFDAIRKQNAYLSSIRIVPLQGISEDVMFYMSSHIEQTRGVKAILHHRSTADQGRWSVVVSHSQFDQIRNEFKANLAKWVQQVCTTHTVSIDASFPAPGLAFKSGNFYDEESDGKGYQSYLSACSSIYSVQTEEGYEGYHNPPDSSRPAPQAWKVNIPSVIATTNPPKPPPQTEPSSMDRLREENAQQPQQISNLTNQLLQLTQQMGELLQEVKSLKALNSSRKQGQPTRTPVQMNVDTSFSSQTSDDV
jgi:hypothetical protein